MRSEQENYTLWLLEEFKVRGVIQSFEYEPDRLCLSGSFSTQKEVIKKNKLKITQRALFLSHSYTYDYKVVWNPEYKGIMFSDIKYIELIPFFLAQYIDGNWVSHLEVKAEWDFNNMTRLFILNQKWVFDKLGIYIQLFKPIEFFRNFFIPERYKLTDKKLEQRKISFLALTFNEWYDLNFNNPDKGEYDGSSIL